MWTTNNRDVLAKLNDTRNALMEWSKTMRRNRGDTSKKLGSRLVNIIDGDMDDESMVELLNIKLKLNWEMEKQEAY